MVKNFVCAAFAALALVGCNEDLVEPLGNQTGDKVQLTVSIPTGETKVTGYPTDTQINNIQVFVCDRNGVYETSDKGRGSALSLTCTTGEKKIVALANAPEEKAVANIAELRARIVDLSACEAGSIVMSGEVTKTLSVSSIVPMQLQRLAAKIAVSKVTTAFTLDAHKNLPFEIKAIYLINVAGTRAYLENNTPTTWYNKGAYAAENSLDFLCDKVTAGQIAAGGSYTTEHYFYCFPNPTDTKTRLVVEAEIGGNIYYYPVTLDQINPNTAYTYSITITRLGSDSPDAPVVDGMVNFSVTVKDWVEEDLTATI